MLWSVEHYKLHTLETYPSFSWQWILWFFMWLIESKGTTLKIVHIFLAISGQGSWVKFIKKTCCIRSEHFTVFLLLCWLYWFLYSQFWAQRGVRIVTWTVNDGREKDYFKLLGVPFMTDTLETWSHAWLFLISQFSCKVRNITTIQPSSQFL